MPSFDSCWRITVGEKKLLFGKHRVAVGGQAPEGAENEGGNIEQKSDQTSSNSNVILGFLRFIEFFPNPVLWVPRTSIRCHGRARLLPCWTMVAG